MDHLKENKEQIIQYLKSGCKTADMPLHFGVELEHFVVKKDSLETVSYYGEGGVEEILTQLLPFYEESDYSEGHLIFLGRKGIALSLEPAAQLEVSIMPQKDINAIQKIYDDFLEEILPILQKYSYELVTHGYQPKSKVEELALIPKNRYRFMDEYFAKIGPFGRQMMRGTAATQVSIDYYSENDFKRKYKIAYALKDVLAYLCSNSPVYEGEEYTGMGIRDYIWSNTDNRRFDVAPFMEDGTLGFEAYADFVLQTPVIVNRQDGIDLYEERTVGELAGERVFSKEEIAHMLSMVFPMVRAKTYLELRFADSMPMEKVLAYVLVLKGLFEDVSYTESWVFSDDFDKAKNPDKIQMMINRIACRLSDKETELIKKELTE